MSGTMYVTLCDTCEMRFFSHDTFMNTFLFEFVNNSTATYSVVTVSHDSLLQSNIKNLCTECVGCLLAKQIFGQWQ